MRVRVSLTIDQIENVNLEEGCSLMVETRWIGRNTKFRFLGKRIKRNCTSARPIRDGGNFIQWNEEFEHSVKLRRIDNGGYKSWFINLEVHEIDGNSKSKIDVAPKARIDIAENLVLGSERIIKIPLNCKIRGNAIYATLEAKLQTAEIRSQRRRRSLSFPNSTSFHLFSCIGGENRRRNSHNKRLIERIDGHELSLSRVRNQSIDGFSSEEEPEPSYKNLKLCKYLIHQFDSKEEEDDSIDERQRFSPNVEILSSSNSFDRQQPQNRSPLQRGLHSLKRLVSFNKNDQPKGMPLLNKSCGDIGGDDIDIERHEESRRESKVHPETLRIFGEDDPFEVGRWEKRSIFSRDLELELVTDVLLATIDQRSERASGGSACTVLAVVIANWLYENPDHLPLRCELDQLVREGSIKWRDLCQDANLRERFPDQHFDLETVLKEGFGELKEMVDLSYFGFFRPTELKENMEFLKEFETFDSIWQKMILNDLGLTKRVYICSWNDHFFVLKIERDVIYLIDTFGERLFEGCNQAYILKFDKNSVIYDLFEVMIMEESKLEMNKKTKEENSDNKQENGENRLEMNNEIKEEENNNKHENGESKLEMHKEQKEGENNEKKENGQSELKMHNGPNEEENNLKQENGESKLEMYNGSKEEENKNKEENGVSKLEMLKGSKEEENNDKQENRKRKLEMNGHNEEENNGKQENGESKLEMHKMHKEEENNDKRENGSFKEEENIKIHGNKNIISTFIDEEIKIAQHKPNHCLTNGSIREEIKCPIEENEEIICPKEEIEEIESPKGKIERDQGKEMVVPSNPKMQNGEKGESSNSKEVICEGIESCREYIKGFLASLPLRQLQEDLKRGFIREEMLHRRLQIEFHYVVPA